MLNLAPYPATLELYRHIHPAPTRTETSYAAFDLIDAELRDRQATGDRVPFASF